MDSQKLEQALKKYVDLTFEIRLLSAPQIESISDADEYRDVLIRNFTRIGALSEEANHVLDGEVYPLLREKRRLDADQRELFERFSKMLVSTAIMSSLDSTLGHMVSSKLISDADRAGDDDQLIRALSLSVESSYGMMRLAFRLVPCSEIGYEYREQGLESADRINEYLDKEKFAALSESSRELVLLNAYDMALLKMRSGEQSDEENRENIDQLVHALSLADDPFYVEHAPGYDWRRHRFSTLENIVGATTRCNDNGNSAELLEEIYTYYQQLEELWNSDKEYFSALCGKNTLDMYRARINYLTGRIQIDEYKAELRRLIDAADKSAFDQQGIRENVFFIDEYLLAIQKTELSSDDESALHKYYRDLVIYVHRMPKDGIASFIITMMSYVIKDYVDIPGENYADFCMRLIVAMHPPTYVHSLTFSSLVCCLTSHLMKKQPEMFVGFAGCKDASEVSSHEKEILDYAERSARLHDIGKLFVMEIIMMYGRKLKDEEFDLIYTHADIGAYVLKAHPDTEPYSTIALSHHFYFNELEDGMADALFRPEERPFVDIACCADGLDAATDMVGRSYKRGKTFNEFLTEIEHYRGTRYAPYVIDLFKDPDVRDDINRILSDDRAENYRNAYEELAQLSEE